MKSERVTSSTLDTSSINKPTAGPEFLIRELAPSDINYSADALSRAFYNDPWINFFLQTDGDAKLKPLLWSMSRIVDYGVKHGRVWGAYNAKTSKLEGVAVWQPPYETGIRYIIMTNTY